jgi:hypothetical protein
MRAIPMLVVRSSVPCLLFANNAPAGEISKEHPAGLPMPENGRCYIHYVPLAQGRLPGAFRLDFSSGELVQPGEDIPARIVRWPRGVIEAEIEPERNPGQGFVPLAPDTLSYADLRDGIRAYILRYVSYWLVLEDQEGKALLSVPLPGGRTPEVMVLNIGGREAVAARAQGSVCDWVVIAAPQENGDWKELFRLENGQMDVDKNGEITSLIPLADTAGHAELTVWSYVGGEYVETRNIVWLDGEPHLPASAEDTARAFLEAWAMGLREEALDYLSQELRAGLSEDDISSFLGDYERIEAARFAPMYAEGEIALALVRKEHGDLFGARPVAIKVIAEESDKGKWKVDNIRAL